MKFTYAIVGLILTVQSVYSAPVDVEELTDPEPRGFFDSLLAVLSRPILSGLTSNGQGGFIDSGSSLISPAINAVTNTGGSFLNNMLGTLDSMIPYTDTGPMNVKNDEELLDIVNALVLLVAELNTGGQIDATVGDSGNGSIVLQDEIDNDVSNVSSGDEKLPIYVVVLDDYS